MKTRSFRPFTAISVRTLTVIAVALLARAFPAGAVEFDLRDPSVEGLDDGDTLSLTSGGITATLSALVNGSSGVFNQTGSGFGINAAGTDSTFSLDGGDGDAYAESVSIQFDKDIKWTGLNLSILSNGEKGSLSLPSFSTPFDLTDTGSGTDIFSFSTDNIVLKGQTVTVGWISGNGFSFDSFSVESYTSLTITPTAVGVGTPAPDGGGTLAMLLAGAGLVGACARRRRPV